MLGSDPHLCAHQIQADWIAPPARTLVTVAGRPGAFAGFRHAITGELMLVEIMEAYELLLVPAVIVKQAIMLDGRPVEALICYDRQHAGTANCHLSFPSALRLVLSEAS